MSKNLPIKPPKEILEKINKTLAYDPKTGHVYVKAVIATQGNKRKVGEVIGTLSEKGYLRTQMIYKGKRKNLMVHLIAWYLYYGVWPEHIVDHEDRNTINNRIKNLREATHTENRHNLKGANKNNKTGVLGVTYYSHDKSKFEVTIKGKRIGVFGSIEDARKARKKTERLMYKQFAPL